MSIAFKNWVMDEQEKEEEKMIYELQQKEFLEGVKKALRSVSNTEILTPNAHKQLNNVTTNINQEIIRIEKLVSEHEQQENPPC